MNAALAVGLIVAAGIFCPAIMWWQRSRGRAAACCLPVARKEERPAEELRRSNANLSTRIAELRSAEQRPGSEGTTAAGG